MTKSDEVRAYAFKTYIAPARATGQNVAAIVAGDVAKALKLTNRLPLVCTALGAMKFRSAHNVSLLNITGPGQSTTTTFTFKI